MIKSQIFDAFPRKKQLAHFFFFSSSFPFLVGVGWGLSTFHCLCVTQTGVCFQATSVGFNRTACQQLANLCVLQMYALTEVPPNTRACGRVPCNGACSLYVRLGTDFDDNLLPVHGPGQNGVLAWYVINYQLSII